MSSSVEVKDRKKEKKDKKDKRREKEAEAATSVYQKATDLAAEERRGTAYRPPPGSILLSDAIESEVFDYDTLKEDDDLELWIIRVPRRGACFCLHCIPVTFLKTVLADYTETSQQPANTRSIFISYAASRYTFKKERDL